MRWSLPQPPRPVVPTLKSTQHSITHLLRSIEGGAAAFQQAQTIYDAALLVVVGRLTVPHRVPTSNQRLPSLQRPPVRWTGTPAVGPTLPTPPSLFPTPTPPKPYHHTIRYYPAASSPISSFPTYQTTTLPSVASAAALAYGRLCVISPTMPALLTSTLSPTSRQL